MKKLRKLNVAISFDQGAKRLVNGSWWGTAFAFKERFEVFFG
jgi:hypothetical protein